MKKPQSKNQVTSFTFHCHDMERTITELTPLVWPIRSFFLFLDFFFFFCSVDNHLLAGFVFFFFLSPDLKGGGG